MEGTMDLGSSWRQLTAIVAWCCMAGSVAGADGVPARPDGGSVLSRAGERTLSLEDVEPAALQAAERARFERIGKVGRYGFELFEAVVLAREAWLDNVLVEREVAAGVELPQPARKALEHGVESLTGAEFNARESY